VATPNAPTITTVTSLSSLYKKTNTAVKVALKRKTEEYEWFDDYPDELITPSGNEMRIVLDVMYQPDTTAMIPDGGYEAQLTTVPPQNGVFTFVQANFRYSFTTLEQAFDKRGRAGMIQQQTLYSAIKAVENFARKIGKQTYGFSTGTVAVVSATGSAGTTQNGVQLKNGYGSTLIPGGTVASNTYLSGLFRNGDPIALIRGGVLVEFGQVTASPSIASGVGFIDTVFNASITPTANDLIVPAAAVTDATLTATDQNRWPVGFLDGLTSPQVHGLATSTAPNWKAGYANTAGGRLSFQAQEALINNLWNNGGVKMNRAIMSQGVRRDVIAGERAALRYNDNTKFNLNGDISTDGVKYMTSVLAPPGMFIGWNNDCIGQKLLSDKPDYEGGPSMFDLDKVQDRGAYAASYNFVYARIWTNRAGTGYLANLTESP
jgi:hypothetical protein